MLTNEDIVKLSEVLATKEDIKELKTHVASLESSLQSLITSVDNLAKAVKDLGLEYSAVKHTVDRHEKWLQQLAKKIGVNLEH